MKTFSAEPELGENTQIVVKFTNVSKDYDTFYIELISEINPLFEQLDKIPLNNSIKVGVWNVKKLTTALSFDAAVKALKDFQKKLG